jgi:subtilisin family serine protease
MALAIQADPFLTSRMAQHLLAMTSRQIDPNDSSVGGWITNAAGYRFNNNYGFGLIDATAFSAAAAFVYDYQLAGGAPLSQQQTNVVSRTFTNAFFAEKGAQSNDNVINVGFTVTNKWTNLPVEYVQVTLQITGFETNMANYTNGTGAIAGDILGQLVSPRGTTNMLFYSDRGLPLNKRSKYNYVDKKGAVHLYWTYLSYAYYGEDPSGSWRLALKNNSTNQAYTNNLKLDFANLTVGVGAFDARCLGDFPFANGTNQSPLPSLARGVQSMTSRNNPFSFAPRINSLFWSGTNAGAGTNYYGEWQLQNQMPVLAEVNAGLDVNIAGAWSNGFTGRGVTIAIVDGGVQGNHPDLNYVPAYSWDFTQSKDQNQTNRFRGYPTGLMNTHGTACAGVAAGIGNGIGVVGAAPEAMVSSLVFQTDGNPHSQKNMPGSLGLSYLYQGQKDAKGRPDAYAPVNWNDPSWTNGVPIRVQSRSLGKSGPGYNVDDIQTADSLALKTATDHGVIVVNSAGNDRPIFPGAPNALATQDANRSKILTAPECIIAGALSSDGLFAYYSSYGCNLFVTAPSSSGNSNNYSIPTTDLIGRLGDNSLNTNAQELFLTNASHYSLFDYTSMFGGTSSSCPLVAGIMAMGVQANPWLTSRMAQHLLALTSRQLDAGDTSAEGRWITNAAGYLYNNNYGFGLIDASAFTTAAAYTYYNQLIGGSPLSLQQTNFATVNLKNSYFVLGNNRTNTVQTSVTITNKYPTLPIEYVHVRVNISGFETNGPAYLSGTGAIPGDLSGYLVSPSGTTNRLFTADRNLPDIAKRSWRPTSIDKKRGGILEWTYLSYAYYGENPSGTWKLVLRNESTSSAYSKNLQLNSVTITTGVGIFDINCLGDFPFSNGPNRVSP